MRKLFLFATTAALLAACSSNDLVDDSRVGDLRNNGEVPIEFNVQKQNITRAANLETVNHYNFGVWAWKVQGKNGLADAEVMNNYLVGYGGSSVGYDHTNGTTWAATTSSTSDHVSPWFYEGLGTAEYTSATAPFYTAAQTAYMSNNANQYLRYWDLAYGKTNFYCYAPYKKNAVAATNDVVFTKDATTSTMVFNATNSIRDGYDEPLNSTYNAYDRSLSEYMYAGVQATNSDLADVTIPFKHMGAQLFIRFYEEIPGYRVEMIDLAADKATTPATDIMKGIQATPAIAGTPNTNGTYYITQGGTVSFTETTAAAAYTPNWEGATTATNTTPLMFKIPTAGLSTAATAPANLTAFAAPTGNTTSHNVIAEASTEGTQTYSYSPTIYYPVAQPTTSTTGLTFHVSYRIIAEDNGEVTTVHNATVHVPYKGEAEIDGTPQNDKFITVWQPNVKYTYTFKITRKSSGTTDPDPVIDPTSPTVSNKVALYPIVFDQATIEDFSTNYSVYKISEETAIGY